MIKIVRSWAWKKLTDDIESLETQLRGAKHVNTALRGDVKRLEKGIEFMKDCFDKSEKSRGLMNDLASEAFKTIPADLKDNATYKHFHAAIYKKNPECPK